MCENESIKQLFTEISQELAMAQEKYPPKQAIVNALIVIDGCRGNLAGAITSKPQNNTNIRRQCVQLAAASLRLVVDHLTPDLVD